MSLNLATATTTYRNSVYTRSVSAGVHTVTIAYVGTATGAKSSVGLDRVQVF